MEKSDLKKFDQAIEANASLEPILAFYRAIVKEQIKVYGKQQAAKELPDQTEVDKLLRQGRPINSQWPVSVNYEQMKALFLKLGEILSEHRPEKNNDIKKITAKDWDFENLAQIFASDNLSPIIKEAEEEQVDPSLLAFLIVNALRPFYAFQAQAVIGLVKDEEWQRPHCPVCGQRGEMAVLQGDGGKRYLYCPTCDVTWKYLRLECPYCDADHEKLRYLEVEDSLYRLDVCENCQGYIKTLDAQELASVPNLFLEDLLTMHLDLLAEKEGYTKDPSVIKQ